METAQDKVIAAANELFETNGKRPTLAELRAYLGGGSMTTISEAMKIWRKQVDARTPEVNTVSLPEDLEKKGNELIIACWQTASTLANDRLAKEREAVAAAHLEYKSQVSEAEEIIAILEHEKNDLQKRFDQSEAALQAEKSQSHDKDAKISNLSRLNETLNDELTALHKKYELQASDYQQTIKETAQVKTDLAVALATNDLLTNQLNELNAMLKTWNIDIDKR